MQGVDIFLGNHSDHEFDPLESMLERCVSVLESDPNQKVVIYLEGPYPEYLIVSVQNRIKKGVLPSLALQFPVASDDIQEDTAIKLLLGMSDRVRAVGQDFVDNMKTKLGTFSANLYGIIDELFIKYNISNEDPRVLVEFEEEVGDSENIGFLRQNEAMIGILLEETENRYTRALEEYKNFILYNAEELQEREDYSAERITALVGEGNWVISRFGTGHLKLVMNLKKTLGEVKHHYPLLENIDREDHFHYFNHQTAILKQILIKGKGSLTDLDWNRSFIAELLYTSINLLLSMPLKEGLDEPASMQQSVDGKGLIDLMLKTAYRLSSNEVDKIINGINKHTGDVYSYILDCFITEE